MGEFNGDEPLTINPNLLRQFSRMRPPPESVMDPRMPEYRKQQDQAELLDIVSNLIPGKGALGAVGSIGLKGLHNLRDANLLRKYSEIESELLKTNPRDWQLQKSIVESNPRWFTVPRGRDADPARPIVKFGHEIPEMELRPDILRPGDTPITDVINSPRHFKAYPDLQNYEVRFDPMAQQNSGYFNAKDKIIGLGPHDTEREMLGTLNHEVSGHHTAFNEGWPMGTSTVQAGDALRRIARLDSGGVELPKELEKQLGLALMMKERPDMRSSIAHSHYRLAAGEQLAEAAAKSAAKGGGFIPKMYTADPKFMYDPQVQRNAIYTTTRKLDEAQYQKDLVDEIKGLMQR